jgi:hypothetical protein
MDPVGVRYEESIDGNIQYLELSSESILQNEATLTTRNQGEGGGLHRQPSRRRWAAHPPRKDHLPGADKWSKSPASKSSSADASSMGRKKAKRRKQKAESRKSLGVRIH